MHRHRLPLVALALAGLIGLAAITDQHVKQKAIGRAQLAEWYCLHRSTRCGGPSSARIEAHWQRRQWAYEIAVVFIGGLAVARLAYTSGPLRRPRD